jgi:hypothetical protein
MTQSTSPNSQPNAQDVRSFTDALCGLVQSDGSIQERVKTLVADLFRSGQSSVHSAGVVLQEGLQSAVDLARRSLPERSDSILRQLFDGTAAGLESTAQSAQYAVSEAASRGRRFADEDLQRMRSDVEGIAKILQDSLRWFSGRVVSDATLAAGELRTHAERAASSALPRIQSAASDMLRHPLQTAAEAAETAVRGGRLTLGGLLGSAGSLLSSAADRIRPQHGEASSAATESATASAGASVGSVESLP